MPELKQPPLRGVRVLDLTTFLSGPYATQILADLGADVVKLEPPAGDSSRSLPPHYVDGESAYFLSINRNKRSISADLKTEQGKDLLLRLAERADILIENFRPGVIERLGLSYEHLISVNPQIVWCSISGFGQSGPYRDRPAYDMIVQALSGGMSLTGEPDGPPVRSGIPVGDLAAGMYAVIGALSALHQRQKTGHGRQIDISMLDCQLSMLTYQAAYHLLADVDPGRQGRAHDSIPTYRAFTAADGVDVMVTANTDQMWRAFCGILHLRHLVDDPLFVDGDARQKHRDQLSPLLEHAFAQQDSSTLLAQLHAAGVPAAPVQTVRQALTDPQVRHRKMVINIPAQNEGPPLNLVRTPVMLDGPAPSPRRPPKLDENRDQILREWLGQEPTAPADPHPEG